LLNLLHRYNWHRPHGSLQANTPVSRLSLSEDNLLRLRTYLISSDAPVISGGTFLDRREYLVAGLWRVEGRESRRADTRVVKPSSCPPRPPPCARRSESRGGQTIRRMPPISDGLRLLGPAADETLT
jgi:hypothetical protein